MQVKDAMHRGAQYVDPDTLITDVAETMRDDSIGAMPVGESDRLIGMVTDRDIVVRGLTGKSDPLQLTVRNVMTKEIVYCLEDEDLDDAVRLMERKEIRRMPVIDKHHRMVGMLSLGDIAAAASPTIISETLRAVSAHHS